MLSLDFQCIPLASTMSEMSAPQVMPSFRKRQPEPCDIPIASVETTDEDVKMEDPSAGESWHKLRRDLLFYSHLWSSNNMMSIGEEWGGGVFEPTPLRKRNRISKGQAAARRRERKRAWRRHHHTGVEPTQGRFLMPETERSQSQGRKTS